MLNDQPKVDWAHNPIKGVENPATTKVLQLGNRPFWAVFGGIIATIIIPCAAMHGVGLQFGAGVVLL